jgi:hypothetical protein
MIGIDFERHAMKASAANKGKNRLRGKGHPTTAAMNYSGDELEFMEAIQNWKKKSGKQFPTWSEVLSILKQLGYDRPSRARQEAFSL